MINTLMRVALFAVALICTGCNLEPETLAALQEAVQASTQSPDSEPEETGIEAVEVAFSTPHPNRVDPFSFPGESTDRPALDPIEIGEPGPIVTEVLGFADVDQPRVLLRIGDRSFSMKVGDQIQSVEVIRIRPPAADLSVDGVVRTITMFDHP